MKRFGLLLFLSVLTNLLSITVSAHQNGELAAVDAAVEDVVDISISPTEGDIGALVAAEVNKITNAGNEVGNIIITLKKGNTYSTSTSIEAPASVTINGNGAIIDASLLSTPFVQMSYNYNTDEWKEVTFNINGVVFQNMQNAVFKSTSRYYLFKEFKIDKCIIDVADNKTVFDFTGGSAAVLFAINNSTIYSNTATTSQFYNSSGGQKIIDANTDYTQTFKIANSTFYNISKGKNIFQHRQSGQKWLIFDVQNSMFVNCGKEGQVIRGLNGGQGSGNPTWIIKGNAFNFDGSDTSANEINGDEDEPVQGSVSGVMSFTNVEKPDFGGTFTLCDGQVAPQTLGDPRWKVNYVGGIFIASTTDGVDMKFQTISNTEAEVYGDATTSSIDNSYKGSITIPNVVKGFVVSGIGDNAFTDCVGLTSVTIPNNVTYIATSAFSGCSGLTTVTIPNGVNNIGNNAFKNCSSLNSIVIPNNVNSIGTQAFYGCSNLASVILNSNALLSKDYTKDNNLNAIFKNQETKFTFGDDVLSIGAYAFYGFSEIKSILISKNITSLGKGCLSGTGLTSIAVEDGNAKFDSRDSCNAVIETATNTLVFGCEKTVIPNSVVALGESAFEDVSLESIKIPKGVTVIGNNAFNGCSNLVSVTVNNETPVAIAPNTFSNSGNATLYVPYGCFDLYSVAEGWRDFKEIKEIGTTEFIHVETEGTLKEIISDLESLTIKNLTITGRLNAADISYLHSNAGRIENLEVLDLSDVTLVPGDDYYNSYFHGTNEAGMSTETIYFYISSENKRESQSTGNGLGGATTTTRLYSNGLAGAFSGCNFKKVVMPKTINEVASFTFMGCSQLESVTYTPAILRVRENAFEGCNNLKTFLLTAACDTIEHLAFSECKSLEYVGDLSGLRAIHAQAFYDCENLIGDPNTQTVDLSNLEETVIWFGDHSSFAKCKSLKQVKLSNKLKIIQDGMFKGCTSLTSIVIPNSVTDIDSYAFSGCTSLANVTLSENLVKLGSGVFSNTPYQNNIVPEDGITYIGKIAVACSKDVTSITIKEGTISISDEMCREYKNLTTVTLPSSIRHIGKKAFYYTAINSINLPEGLLSIGEMAFYYCSLKVVTLPESLQEMGEMVFDGCNSLIQVNFNARKISGGSYIFSSTKGLEKVVFGPNVEYIPEYAFMYSSLVKATFKERTGDTHLYIDNEAFSECKSLTSISLPLGTDSIGSRMFFNCESLRSIDIPDGIQEIGKYGTEGYGCFYGCKSLTSLKIPKGVEGISITYCEKLQSAEIHAKKVSASSNPALKDLVLGDEVEYISGFSDYLGESIIIPDGVKELHYAFQDCENAKEIYIGKSVEKITLSFIFTSYRPSSLEKVTINCKANYGKDFLRRSNREGKEKFNTLIIGGNAEFVPDYAFEDWPNLNNVTITGNVKVIGNSAFCGSKIKKLVLGEKLEAIGEKAFGGCGGMGDIELPIGVKTIESGTFQSSVINTLSIPGVETIKKEAFTNTSVSLKNSDNLKNIEEKAFENSRIEEISIPSGVTIIPYHAFYNCEHLKKVELSEGLTKIRSYAFFGCTSLQKIEFPNTLQSIDDYAFKNCVLDMPTLYIPGSVSYVGYGAFMGDSIKSLYIGEGVEKIEGSAFSMNNNLKSVVLPSTIQEIGKSAFSSCDNLVSTKMYHASPNTIETYSNTSYFGLRSKSTLYVPKAYIDSYRGQAPWTWFKEIIPFEDNVLNSLSIKNDVLFNSMVNSDNTELTDTIVNNVYYNFNPDGHNGYSEETGSIILSSSLSEIQMEAIKGKEIADIAIPANFNGLIFQVPAGQGKISITAQTHGQKDLNIKIGGSEAKKNQASTKETIDVGYEVNESTYVYVYATESIEEQVSAKSYRSPKNVDDNYIELFGYSWSSIPAAVVPEITAENKSREYGNENPQFTFTTSAELNGQPELTTTATKESPVGDYDIVVGRGTVVGDYTSKNGILTITQAPLIVKAESYTIKQGDALPEFAATYSGFKNGEDESVLTKKPTLSTAATLASAPGEYDILVSGAEAQNYSFAYEKGTLTVEAIVVTPIEEETTIDTNGLGEEDLTNNVVGDVYYNVGDEGYDSEDNSVVIGQTTNMQQITDATPGSSDVSNLFTGLILKIGAGFGMITISAKTAGNASLAIQIGNGTPTIVQKTEKGDIKVPYNLAEDTYVYVYSTAANSSNARALLSLPSDFVKIYNIKIVPGATGIGTIDLNESSNKTWYTIDGKNLQAKPTKRGIYIVNGEKVIVK